MRRSPLPRRLPAAAMFLALLVGGCGRQGPPLPPLAHRPRPVTGLEVRQLGEVVLISFILPGTNLDGSQARIGTIRLLRRRARLVDAGPEGIARRVRHFDRGAKEIGTWSGGEIEALAAGSGAMEVPDLSALNDREAGFLLAYQVSVLGAGSDKWTSSELIFMEPAPPPGPPDRLRAGKGIDGVLLEWDRPISLSVDPERAGIELKYSIYRVRGSDPSGGRVLNPEPIAAQQFLDPILPGEGEFHLFWVRTVLERSHGRVESVDSNHIEIATPRLLRPPAPVQVTLVVTGRLIRVVWYPPDVAGLGGFRVYRREEGREEFVSVAELPPSEVRFTDAAAMPGVRYWYRVVAFSGSDSALESVAGEEVSGIVITEQEPGGE